MLLTYTVSDSDYLNYQLYVASKSPQIAKKRRRVRVLVPVAYVIMALYGYFKENYTMAITFAVVAILWWLLYPLRDRKIYINHYKRFIQENLQTAEKRNVTLEISPSFFVARDGENESKIGTAELAAINETGELFLIRLKTAQTFILPKSAFSNTEEIERFLKDLAWKQHVPYTSELNWKWA